MSHSVAEQNTIIDLFLEGINNSSLSTILSIFAPDAEIIDDGKTFTGDALVAFCQQGLIDHNARVNELKRQQLEDGRTFVHVMMSGDFVEEFGITDPFDLYILVSFAPLNSQGGFKVKHIDIGGVDPDKPSMMSVYAASGHSSDPLSSVRYARKNIPAPKEGWALVKMRAVGLNYHDIFTLRGVSMHPLRFPLILGSEGAGTLEDGTSVAIYPAMGNPDYKDDETLDPDRQVLGELAQGTLAEYALVPKRSLVTLPPGMTPQTAAVMGVAWLTAYRMLFTKARLRPGQIMLVQGSSGGVTTALIQMGSAAGMQVWTTGRTPAKRQLAERLGAHRTFEPGAQLPCKVDAVFDSSGKATFDHSLSSVKAGGVIVSCGVHSGLEVTLDLRKFFVEQVVLTGVYLGTLQEFKDLLQFVAAKKIVPHIGKVVKMSQAEEGLRDMIEGRTEGKIVVEIS